MSLHLRIQIYRGNEKSVDLTMPGLAATWIIELIPQDIMKKIEEKNIDLLSIQARLKKDGLVAGDIFSIETEEKKIKVWLE